MYSLFNEPNTDAIELDYPMQTPHNLVVVVDSCNGLVCLVSEEDSIFLWNPSTREDCVSRILIRDLGIIRYMGLVMMNVVMILK